ncbi:YopX family protein [Staphylococcus hominis]|uniref:YopX family protein n=1 Tax=Staphylococcus hominis TaxID=1290 RepID=UPI00206CAC34|nr:MAG TPA: YopX protein [Caudoviricetes sp.]
MKNFKFRAWDKELKIMCDVLKIDFKNKTLFYHHWAHGVSTEVDLNEVEIMQSTGLKDISGTEIYEGDIVENIYKEIGFIKNCNDALCFSRKERNFYLSGIGAGRPFKILGNIYENPELLEGE